MCGQLKTLIDRCCPSYRKLGGKDYYLLMTAEETGADTFEETVACFPRVPALSSGMLSLPACQSRWRLP